MSAIKTPFDYSKFIRSKNNDPYFRVLSSIERKTNTDYEEDIVFNYIFPLTAEQTKYCYEYELKRFEDVKKQYHDKWAEMTPLMIRELNNYVYKKKNMKNCHRLEELEELKNEHNENRKRNVERCNMLKKHIVEINEKMIEIRKVLIIIYKLIKKTELTVPRKIKKRNLIIEE